MGFLSFYKFTDNGKWGELIKKIKKERIFMLFLSKNIIPLF